MQLSMCSIIALDGQSMRRLGALLKLLQIVGCGIMGCVEPIKHVVVLTCTWTTNRLRLPPCSSKRARSMAQLRGSCMRRLCIGICIA